MTVVTIAERIAAGAAELVTGPFGTQLGAHEYVADGTPVINVRNVGYGDVRTADLEYVDDETADRLARHRLRAGDIVFGRKGAVERHAFMASEHDGWVQGSDCIRLRLDPNVMNPRYVSFAFRTEWHQRWMQNHCSSAATMASLNQDILRLVEIPAVSLAEQASVADVLGAFDDLIENNRRWIETLEEMARLIYHEWFVHFRFPGHEDVELVDSDLGPIPETWAITALGKVASVNRRSVRKGEDLGEILYVDISSVGPRTIGTAGGDGLLGRSRTGEASGLRWGHDLVDGEAQSPNALVACRSTAEHDLLDWFRGANTGGDTSVPVVRNELARGVRSAPNRPRDRLRISGGASTGLRVLPVCVAARGAAGSIRRSCCSDASAAARPLVAEPDTH